MISLPNSVLNDSHRRDGHVYLLVGNYFSDALGALKPSTAARSDSLLTTSPDKS